MPILRLVPVGLCLAACATGPAAPADLSCAASMRLSRDAGPDGSRDMAAPAAPAASAPAIIGDSGYTRLRFGTFDPANDLDFLDTGFYGDISFGTEVLPILAIEGTVGYLRADGPLDQELEAVPLLVSGRLQVPITILEFYGGLGLGGLYADYSAGSISDDEFLFAGTAFLGVEVGLGNLAAGIEYRYLATEETSEGVSIEGHSGLLTLTLPF